MCSFHNCGLDVGLLSRGRSSFFSVRSSGIGLSDDLWFTYDGECLRQRFSENRLGIADYHHPANFVDVSIYIIIFRGARISSKFLDLSLKSLGWLRGTHRFGSRKMKIMMAKFDSTLNSSKSGLNQQKLENCNPEGKAADFRLFLPLVVICAICSSYWNREVS
ncbi:Uncharacterized protein Rs2_15826 [Raphanus sativus]|nr:Uncharacterized protein Rs2_15826 [Raphanus sativus]